MNRQLPLPSFLAAPGLTIERLVQGLRTLLTDIVSQLNSQVQGVGPALASAAAISPSHPIHHVTGTAAIATITAPLGFSGPLWLIADGAWSLTTAGNIGRAVTAVVNGTVMLTYDPVTAKWWPAVQSVGSAELADNSVGSSEIADGAVLAAKVGADWPHVRAHRTAALSLANNVVTTVPLTAERFDVGTCHDNATNPSRLTAPRAGLYSIFASVAFAANATGIRFAYLLHQGATWIGIHGVAAMPAGVTTHMTLATSYRLAAGEYVELQAYQNSGGALDLLSTAAYGAELGMQWVGP